YAPMNNPRPMTIRALFEKPGYDAECSYSADGRYVLYVNVPEGTKDGDIYVFDTVTGKHTPLVVADGYDGGPFFSRDGRYITYRSDRAGNDLLQVYVAKLAFDGEGPTGIEWERPVTANRHVNWGPYWSRGGDFLVYSTSEVGHHNYEVFAAESNTGDDALGVDALKTRRVTHAAGFDGLPVFSENGRWMLWTSQRLANGDAADAAPGSQVWAARVVGAKPE
ncbi:MAG: TolB family protein, partial [Phycisphaerales bacterium]